MSLSKQELFDWIRRDSWQQQLSIRALSKKYGVHRRLVREALASPVPKPRKRPARPSPRMERLVLPRLSARWSTLLSRPVRSP
ncbi:hypothetical protein [Streptomyces milbemycinicus]|uniref:Transposase n=1 Tax=Streptomyces milbemycinicus TaxID=476552 RepID=A0ABW8M8M5_9ACTN